MSDAANPFRPCRTTRSSTFGSRPKRTSSGMNLMPGGPGIPLALSGRGAVVQGSLVNDERHARPALRAEVVRPDDAAQPQPAGPRVVRDDGERADPRGRAEQVVPPAVGQVRLAGLDLDHEELPGLGRPEVGQAL